MKHLLYICLFISLLILSACSDSSEGFEQNETTQDSDSKVEQNQKTSEQSDNNNEDNDDGMFSMGDFETLKGKNDVGTYETGPISLTIKSVAVKRGETNEDFLNGRLPEGEIEFVEVLMTMTSEKRILILQKIIFS